jgi:hypothetical protein
MTINTLFKYLCRPKIIRFYLLIFKKIQRFKINNIVEKVDPASKLSLFHDSQKIFQ